MGDAMRKTLRERFDEKVDKSGDCWLWTAAKMPTGYGAIRVNRQTLYAHRVAYELYCGPIPDGMHIDHICSVEPCVNPAHLRLATPKQNAEHHVRLSSRNKSGYRGVSKHEDGKWVANVGHKGKRLYLGLFDTPEEAAEAARLKRLELFTHNDTDRSEAA